MHPLARNACLALLALTLASCRLATAPPASAPMRTAAAPARFDLQGIGAAVHGAELWVSVRPIGLGPDAFGIEGGWTLVVLANTSDATGERWDYAVRPPDPILAEPMVLTAIGPGTETLVGTVDVDLKHRRVRLRIPLAGLALDRASADLFLYALPVVRAEDGRLVAEGVYDTWSASAALPGHGRQLAGRVAP